MAEEHHGESPNDQTASASEVSPIAPTEDLHRLDEHASRLVHVLDGFLAELKAGKAPDREKLLDDNPELADQLEACLAGIEFIHGASGSGPSSVKKLGDFQIVREVGRGGMGAVYEAEQISLRRRVALKVMRFGGVSDPSAIERFQREAETVAHLHHTNIVPIFAVGSEHGVNYYAMQFIEGRSLDQVLRERGEAADPETVAQWGLQAAEALAHAHARGVIHRDVKPSNLILDDAEGRIWLTDFGLAKRLNDVTLSMTGALLGTPRYMSPEQAAAAHHKLDHRTDIYSLGASLYELATGKPVFIGDSPHNVISQILTVEPDPPRKHRPSLPRDLETILMKCLSKEPGRRYETARQLAEDLRAFLDGRSIAARRASLIERTTRWVKRQRRSVGLTVAAVAATLLLVTSGITGSYVWQRSRLAFVMLKTDHPPLVAELLQDGELTLPPVTVPTQQRIEVPSGKYEMRVSSDGRLSQTFDVSLDPRESLDRKLDLEDQLLWSDLKLDRPFRLVSFVSSHLAPQASLIAERSTTLDGKTDFVAMADDGLQCLAGTSGELRWELKLKRIERTPKTTKEGNTVEVDQPTHAMLEDGVWIDWPWNDRATYSRGWGVFDQRPWVVSVRAESRERNVKEPTRPSSFDLNGDGVSDLIIAPRHQTWVLAVSGVDGEPLWVAARGSAADAQRKSTVWDQGGGEAVAYQPAIVPDQDGDGVSELLVTFMRKADAWAAIERWIELVSGSSGEAVWRYDLPDDLFQLPAGKEVPNHLMWFYGRSGGMSSSGGGFDYTLHYAVRQLAGPDRDGDHAYLPTEPVARLSESPMHDSESRAKLVTFLAGTHLVQLDLSTGTPIDAPQETGVRTGIQPRYSDFDGDAAADVLLMEQLPDRLIPHWSGNVGVPRKRLAVWSPSKKSLLWEREVESDWPRQQDRSVPLPQWPQIVDLDGDGASGVLVPDGSTPARALEAPPWGQLALLDGRNGQPRWRRHIFNMDRELRQFTAGPDINGDGVAEVYCASLWGKDFRLFVDCLSGHDGHPLWRTEHPLLSGDTEGGTYVAASFVVANLSWYEGTGDGWPQLVVPVRAIEGDVADRVLLVSAGTGRVTHVAGDVTEVEAGDLDANGVDDLVLFRRTNRDDWDQGGTLHAIRGVGREAWRKIISRRTPVGDLDGDGVQDLVAPNTRGPLTAISGATGRPIWETTIDTDRRDFYVRSMPLLADLASSATDTRATDLDGDGTPDLLLAADDGSYREKLPVVIAVSGRTGRRIWRTDFVVQRFQTPLLLECRDLDRDGEAEIVLVAPTDFGLAVRDQLTVVNSKEVPLWLVVLSGRDGRMRWNQPLTEPQRSGSGGLEYQFDRVMLRAVYADLDQDRVDDVLLPAQRAPDDRSLDLRAFSGSDGRALWQLALPNIVIKRDSFHEVHSATAGDLDMDGRPEVIVPSLATSTNEQGRPTDVLRIQAIDGGTGHVRWQWAAPADRSKNRGGNPENNTELRPVLVRRPDGKRWIAIAFAGPHNERELRVLNDEGKLVSGRTTKQIFSGVGTSRLWTLDSDGDGRDELVSLGYTEQTLKSPVTEVRSSGYWNDNFGELSLLRPENLDEPIWTRAEPLANLHQVLGILPDESTAGRIVVLGGRGGSSIRGIDPEKGEAAWTCVGPAMEPRQVYERLEQLLYERQAQLLNPPTADMPPHALFQFGGQSLVRRGVLAWRQASSSPMDTDTHKLVARGPHTWKTFSRPAATLTPSNYDRRLLRPLPWKPSEHDLRETWEMTAWAIFYGLTLAAIPVGFVGWLVWRRRWGMKSMLMLPVVTGIVMLGLLISPDDSDIRPLLNKLTLAYFAAGPVMLTLAMLAKWLRERRRWRVIIWLLIALLAALAMSIIELLDDPALPAPLQPGERYSLEGWYIILLPTLLLMCWLTVLVVSAAWLIRTAWRWIKMRRMQSSASGS